MHLGRKDSQVKIRGRRIEPAEIEMVRVQNSDIAVLHGKDSRQAVFGQRLPLATLLEVKTVEYLAYLLRQESWAKSRPSMAPVQPGGSRPAFFYVHPIGGVNLHFRDLANHLGSDQPFYGLYSQGWQVQQPLEARIEDIAAYFIQEIHAVQPEGPYFLGGHSVEPHVRLLFPFERVAELFFSTQESALLRGLPPKVREVTFFSWWARKEAYAKACGRGMALPFDQVAARQTTTGHCLLDLTPPPGYVAALATEGNFHALKRWQWC